MSCLRQRRFLNPIKDENRTGMDKYVITGNCGDCASCRKRKQNDWLVRSYFEYMSKPTDGFFVTLDFDDEHLPKFKDQPCFDSQLMSKFFESLRYILSADFRYIYSSHFGDAFNRPHYHVAFLFDKGSIDEVTFVNAVNRYWIYGQHEDISKMRSVRGNPMAAFEYIVKYATRSRKFKYLADRLKMPRRYRPQTYASIGFGAQALDPKEFNSDRLIQEGVIFNDRPFITRDYILNNSLVYIDIKNDGILVPFAIPSYYEYKLMFDYSYDSDSKRSSLTKNDYGRELQSIRHNADYLHLYNDFINSAQYSIHLDTYVQMIYQEVFPDSPYCGVSWRDVVEDVTFDKDRFFDFCKFYKFLMFDCSRPGYLRYRPLRFTSGDLPYYSSRERVNFSFLSSDIRYFSERYKPYSLKGYSFKSASLDGTFDSWLEDDVDLFIYAMSYFQIWKDVQRHRKAEFEDWKNEESIKARIKEKAKNNISYYWHLRRHNFKWYNLNPKSYVSQYHPRKGAVQVESTFGTSSSS